MQLRVGICGCAPSLHGQIEGAQISITQLGGKNLPCPMLVFLEEVLIPGVGHHQQEVQEAKCHLFVDFDGGATLERVWVSELKSPMIGSSSGTIAFMERWWHPEILPSSHDITTAICEMIEQLPSMDILARWVAHRPEPRDPLYY